jgi:hypothetical protein
MGGIDPQVKCATDLQLAYISMLAFVESKRKLTPFFPLGSLNIPGHPSISRLTHLFS